VECLYPSFYIRGERGYKEDNQVSYNMITISNLSLLTYFTYILIDIVIYAMRSISWSSLLDGGPNYKGPLLGHFESL
jgi:hypothetical protein